MKITRSDKKCEDEFCWKTADNKTLMLDCEGDLCIRTTEKWGKAGCVMHRELADVSLVRVDLFERYTKYDVSVSLENE